MVLLHAGRQLISHKKLKRRKDKDIFEVQSFCNCRDLGRNVWWRCQPFIQKMCLLCKYISQENKNHYTKNFIAVFPQQLLSICMLKNTVDMVSVLSEGRLISYSTIQMVKSDFVTVSKGVSDNSKSDDKNCVYCHECPHGGAVWRLLSDLSLCSRLLPDITELLLTSAGHLVYFQTHLYFISWEKNLHILFLLQL